MCYINLFFESALKDISLKIIDIAHYLNILLHINVEKFNGYSIITS